MRSSRHTIVLLPRWIKSKAEETSEQQPGEGKDGPKRNDTRSNPVCLCVGLIETQKDGPFLDASFSALHSPKNPLVMASNRAQNDIL